MEGLIEVARDGQDSQSTQTAKEVTDAMIELLFPAAAQLRGSEPDVMDVIGGAQSEVGNTLSGRRVAHEQVFRFYLEHVEGPDLLASYDTERALDRMIDRTELDTFIRSLDPARWQDVVSNISGLQHRFRREHAVPGIIVLLNLWPDMPQQQSGPGDLGLRPVRNVVRRAVEALLSKLESDESAAEAAVQRILPELTSLSSKLELVLQIGYGQHGLNLVSRAVANMFETGLANEILAAPADQLAKEREVLRILEFAKHHSRTFEVPDSCELMFTLLRSAFRKVITMSFDGSPSQQTTEPNWNRLIALFDGVDSLQLRVSKLKASFEDLMPWIQASGMSQDAAEDLLLAAELCVSIDHGETRNEET